MFMVIFPAKASDRATRQDGGAWTANSEFFFFALVHATRIYANCRETRNVMSRLLMFASFCCEEEH
jgi:hypothetical protein